jgi:hypothetical protein
MFGNRTRSMLGSIVAVLWLAASPAAAEDEVKVESVPLKGPSVRYEVEQRVPSKTDPIEVRVPDSAPAVEVPEPVEVPAPVEVESTPTRRGVDLGTGRGGEGTGVRSGSDGELIGGKTGRRNPSTIARKMDGYEYCGRGCGGKAKPFKRGQGKWYVKCKDKTKKCTKNCGECTCQLFKSAKGSDEREHHGPGNSKGKVRLPDNELNKDWYCYCVKN